MDKTGRREDDGERGYVGGATAGVSAMVGEGEGERQGACGGVQAVEGATWRSTSTFRGEAARRWSRGELAHAGVTSLPAWRGRSSWLARASTALGRQVGRLEGSGQVSRFLILFSVFFYFCQFVAFLKMLRHFQKLPDYTCSLYGTYPTWNILVWDYLDI